MPSNRMSTIVSFISFLAILLNSPSVSPSSGDDRWGGSFGQDGEESARRAGKRPAGEGGSRGRQQNEPRIIYEPSAADVVHTDAANFKNVVQRLTGQNAPSLNQGHQAGAMHGRRPSRFFMQQQQLQLQPSQQQQQMHPQFDFQHQQQPQDIDSLNDALQRINQRLDNLRRSLAWDQRSEVTNQITKLMEERKGIVNKIGELANQ